MENIPEQNVLSSAENVAKWSAMAPDSIAALDPDGDYTKKHLLNPVVLALIGDVAGKSVLDAGAGQGYFSRMLARRGAIVTSVEPADALIAHSRSMERHNPLGVQYVQADLTTATLDPIFDVVVANMVFQSIHDWTRALAACASALRPAGTLVFSINHPCYEIAEQRELRTDPHVIVRDYLNERTMDLPVAPDFHRTISTYVNGVIGAGLVITGFEEPMLSDIDAALVSPDLS